MSITLRPAELKDAEVLVDIYNPYIKETTVTYEYDEITAEEFAGRMESVMGKYPYIVAEEDGNILGYAYGSPYHVRAAYQWDCDLSVYLRMDSRGKGVGKLLFEKLLDILKKQGYVNAYSFIDSPNPMSEALHKKFGFNEIGCLEKAGYKFGRWLDMKLWGKRIADPVSPSEIDFDWRKYL